MRRGHVMANTILIVDDDCATRIGLCELLEDAGFECTGAASFHEARARLRTSQPDLLITDIRLDDYNGLQLAIGRPRTMPTIVITAFADPVLEAEATRIGARYIRKPLNPRDFPGLVREMLGAISRAGT
jgi:DNA-binding response OmpR family regulator